MFKLWQQKIGKGMSRSLTVGLSLLLLSGCKLSMPTQTIGYKECWPCAVYDKLYNALNIFVGAVMKNCCTWAIDLMGIGLLFWLLFHVGKFVVSIQEPNMRKFIFPITTILFKAMIVYSILYDADVYIEWISGFVQGILEGFITLSNNILDSDSVIKGATTTQTIPTSSSETGSVIFTVALKYKFLNLIYRMYAALSAATTLAAAMMSYGNVVFFFGLFLIIMMWWLLLTMPLSFMDSFVRMAVMVVLSPFILVAWVFPVSAKHLKKLWGIFLGTSIVLLFSCFYIAVSTYAVLTYVQKGLPSAASRLLAESDPELVEQMVSCSVGSLGFFVLILALNRLAGVIPKIAQQFAGETAPSSFTKVMQGFKKVSIGVAKVAVAGALLSPTVAKEALGDMKQAAKDVGGAGMRNDGNG